MQSASKVIHLGQIEINFLLESSDTGGAQSVFVFTVQPGAKVPAPHHHEGFDELLYGLEGVLTMSVSGQKLLLGPGEHCFVPRGIVHQFVNEGVVPTKTLTVITPGLLGPQYFRDVAALMGQGPPDLDKVKEVMLRHGLVPAQ